MTTLVTFVRAKGFFSVVVTVFPADSISRFGVKKSILAKGTTSLRLSYNVRPIEAEAISEEEEYQPSEKEASSYIYISAT